MKAIAINGSPRKTWNTATLLENALRGCGANGAETEMVHLYDLAYQGCTSCFSCKKIGGESYGRCAMRDELSSLLDRAAQADILILGSPFYFHTETGEMRSFMERLLFPYLTYTPDRASIAPRRISTALVYTMNAPEEEMPAVYQDSSVGASRGIMTRVLGSCEVLLCTDTYQFDDYSKYVSTRWDPAVKARRRKDVFPQDCERAYELGARLVAAARCS
ncbi:MAG: flavodoxin family protein [Thermoleophilia bacterium]|nr:flavodoxin family protein [Thermoleophilia bacterium]